MLTIVLLAIGAALVVVGASAGRVAAAGRGPGPALVADRGARFGDASRQVLDAPPPPAERPVVVGSAGLTTARADRRPRRGLGHAVRAA